MFIYYYYPSRVYAENANSALIFYEKKSLSISNFQRLNFFFAGYIFSTIIAKVHLHISDKQFSTPILTGKNGFEVF